ncbi:hypothetical protein [Micromonospora kangleipakensis]|uniref:hypothetical protein n=1 Tax=Micromonospora kangleipakensis TaxID=1077942 RepID=UPI0010298D39|nr:hypothetical protein [Micromonospora kangleipakensis]
MTDPNGLISPGRPAPGFTLPGTPDGRQVGPGQLRGHPVIDRQGAVTWSHLSPTDVNPGVDGILDALERLETNRRVTAG